MAERAERILIGVKLVIEMPDDCPDREVPLTFKRHLLMFFKEAVHNCARHSGATEVRVSISVTHEFLELCLRDNGCGFDPQAQLDGWGVDSMGKRAREMGGEMKLNTRPGEGTAITLKVPLNALLKKTVHSYKTSN
jgi:signal transduction histidine kinase